MEDISFNKNNYIPVYYDAEFTGLTKDSSFISIGMEAGDYDVDGVTQKRSRFYAEFIDYNTGQVDDWIRDNVIANLILEGDPYITTVNKDNNGRSVTVKGTRLRIRGELIKWLNNLHRETGKKILFCCDCPMWDWVLLTDLIVRRKSALALPNYIYYIPLDLASMLAMLGVDPNVNREELLKHLTPEVFDECFDKTNELYKHNAMYDATVIHALFIAIEAYRDIRSLKFATEIIKNTHAIETQADT